MTSEPIDDARRAAAQAREQYASGGTQHAGPLSNDPLTNEQAQGVADYWRDVDAACERIMQEEDILAAKALPADMLWMALTNEQMAAVLASYEGMALRGDVQPCEVDSHERYDVIVADEEINDTTAMSSVLCADNLLTVGDVREHCAEWSVICKHRMEYAGPELSPLFKPFLTTLAACLHNAPSADVEAFKHAASELDDMFPELGHDISGDGSMLGSIMTTLLWRHSPFDVSAEDRDTADDIAAEYAMRRDRTS